MSRKSNWRKATGNKQFKFSNAREGRGKDESHNLHPAYANVRIKSKTLEGAMSEFQRTHGNSDHEWAYVVDSSGFVHRYVEGNAHSVSVYSGSRDSTILHNHPSGGAFSKNDMLAIASQPARGIVASGSKYDYVLQKGTHFRADAFRRAVNNATMTGKTYDDAVDKWLTAHQRDYHYKYHRKAN